MMWYIRSSELVWYDVVSLAYLLVILIYNPWLMAMFLKNVTYMLSYVLIPLYDLDMF
jgi:hypothetical protein